jgi:menaquinone-dependent protoporphyrinogen IX oxidase/uncharacterized protein YhbP (UPF0306 family)
MQRTLILYESRLGSTKEAAGILSMILGPARLQKIGEENGDLDPRDLDFLVIGAPVYKGVISPLVWNYIRKNKSRISDIPSALFCTCLDKKGGNRILDDMAELIGKNVLIKKAIGGRLAVDRIEEKDIEAMQAFFNRMSRSYENIDMMALEEIVSFGMEIKATRDSLLQMMAEDELMPLVEAFLASHKTCTLATAFKRQVRATPLEYTYQNGNLYMISEGGVKFANLIQNDSVSVAINDEYRSMESLAGMQISGFAEMLDPGSKEYADVLRLKGISQERISSLGIAMNMIKVKIKKIEFLNARLKAKGQQITQILTFD